MENNKNQMEDFNAEQKDQINHIDQPAKAPLSPAEDIGHPDDHWHVESGEKVNDYTFSVEK